MNQTFHTLFGLCMRLHKYTGYMDMENVFYGKI